MKKHSDSHYLHPVADPERLHAHPDFEKAKTDSKIKKIEIKIQFLLIFEFGNKQSKLLLLKKQF